MSYTRTTVDGKRMWKGSDGTLIHGYQIEALEELEKKSRQKESEYISCENEDEDESETASPITVLILIIAAILIYTFS